MVRCAMLVACSMDGHRFKSQPEPAPMLADMSVSTWIKKADLCTVSRCHTRGESEDHTSKKAFKGSTLAVKPGADITRTPKQGYKWPHEKELCPPKLKKERKYT